MSLNYTQLVSAIYAYLSTDENGMSTDDVNTIIRQAEQRIYYEVQIPVLKKNVTGTATAGNRFLSTPSDYLATYSMAVVNNTTGDYEYLLPKEVAFLREAYPNPTYYGTPRYYALFDNDTILMAPTPDVSYTVELNYFYEPASIVDTSTSWLGNEAENALLYACLVEGYVYLKGEADMMAKYEEKYQSAIAELRVIGEGRNRSDTYRNDPRG